MDIMQSSKQQQCLVHHCLMMHNNVLLFCSLATATGQELLNQEACHPQSTTKHPLPVNTVGTLPEWRHSLDISVPTLPS